jgi:pSer/pThr/pTyr-binding forkhead associated (FHA) protein
VDFALIRLQSDGKTASAPIAREHTLIGRQTGCQLRIRSGEVSRKHAEIRFEEGAARSSRTSGRATAPSSTV